MAVDSQNAKSALECRRWKKELSLAEKRERDWRSNSDKVVKRYRGEEKKRNRYNVLWATTETLRPAIYNSKPSPDVRRRFRDNDPLGKAVGETLERSLFVLFDADEPDSAIRNDLLDSLLSGRGVSRIRYVPQLAGDGKTRPDQAPRSDAGVEDEDGEGGSEPHEDDEGSYEQVEYEQVAIEHVDWRDYREGYGRTWGEVPWVGFRHKLTRLDAEKKLNKEDIVNVKFSVPTSDDPKEKTDEVGETQKVAEFWEIWDKIGQKVFFVQEEVEKLLFPTDTPDGEPPLDFEGFFPCPDPLAMIENTGSRIPITPFTLYENQANELDKISVRIDRIVNICRLRGIYDSKLVEIPDLLSDDDNELTPVQNAQAWAGQGGLEGAIAWLPIEQVKAVLEALYDARDRQKGIIDELTGVSDIVRGATDPNETASAQQLKSNYHSIRLSRMQGEVKRYVKDLMRLASQVISSKFSSETLAAMTDLKFPTQQQKALMQAQAQMAQQQGQPPNPNALTALRVPTWEDILGMLHSPAMRQFRVDVETDSTIAATLDSDMAALSTLLKAISQVMTELAPLVESQALPVDAAKEIVMAVIRRARLGTAVEDAFDKMQAPQPKPDPHAAKAQADVQKNAQDNQAAAQLQEMKGQQEQALQSMREQMENSRIQFVEQQKTEREQMLEAHKTARDALEARFDAAVKIIVAQIAATKAADSQAGPTAESDFQRGVQ